MQNHRNRYQLSRTMLKYVQSSSESFLHPCPVYIVLTLIKEPFWPQIENGNISKHSSSLQLLTQGGAHIFQKILSVERGPRWRLWWPSFGFEAGASKRRGHWRLERFFDKISLKSFYTFCESESFLTNFSLFLFYMFSS